MALNYLLVLSLAEPHCRELPVLNLKGTGPLERANGKYRRHVSMKIEIFEGYPKGQRS
jgi:hypothetical protein